MTQDQFLKLMFAMLIVGMAITYGYFTDRAEMKRYKRRQMMAEEILESIKDYVK